MLGHVLQANGKQITRGQFKDLLDMLKIYASENFPMDEKNIESLFGSDIKTPVIKEPDEPKPKDGNKIEKKR